MTICGQPPLRKQRIVTGSKSLSDHSCPHPPSCTPPSPPHTQIHTTATAPEEAVLIQRTQPKRMRGESFDLINLLALMQFLAGSRGETKKGKKININPLPV